MVFVAKAVVFSHSHDLHHLRDETVHTINMDKTWEIEVQTRACRALAVRDRYRMFQVPLSRRGRRVFTSIHEHVYESRAYNYLRAVIGAVRFAEIESCSGV